MFFLPKKTLLDCWTAAAATYFATSQKSQISPSKTVMGSSMGQALVSLDGQMHQTLVTLESQSIKVSSRFLHIVSRMSTKKFFVTFFQAWTNYFKMSCNDSFGLFKMCSCIDKLKETISLWLDNWLTWLNGSLFSFSLCPPPLTESELILRSYLWPEKKSMWQIYPEKKNWRTFILCACMQAADIGSYGSWVVAA